MCSSAWKAKHLSTLWVHRAGHETFVKSPEVPPRRTGGHLSRYGRTSCSDIRASSPARVRHAHNYRPRGPSAGEPGEESAQDGFEPRRWARRLFESSARIGVVCLAAAPSKRVRATKKKCTHTTSRPFSRSAPQACTRPGRSHSRLRAARGWNVLAFNRARAPLHLR